MNNTALRVVFIIMLALFLSSNLAISQEINQAGKTEVIFNSNNNKIRVLIKSVKVSTPPSISQFYEKKNVSIIEMLTISVNGSNIFVPRSVFTDLFEANKASIKEEKKGFVLILSGADGSESYEIRVYFDKQKVSRRTLSAGENETITQDTHYKLIVD